MCDDASPQLNPDQYRGLIEIAFPDLPISYVSYLAAGWDSTGFMVNDHLVFRFPMRDAVEQSLLKEIALLGQISPRLPFPTPAIKYIAPPSDLFPWHFVGYEMIAGHGLNEDRLNASELVCLSRQLALFLRELHAIPPESLAETRITTMRQETWWESHRKLFLDAETALRLRLDERTNARFRRSWEEALFSATASSFRPVLIHGDLGAEHILVDVKGSLLGIIDFGDAMITDPALDFAGMSDALAKMVLDGYASDESSRSDLLIRRSLYRKAIPLHAIVAGLELHRDDLVMAGIAQIQQGE